MIGRKPFSPACERNQEPIAQILQPLFAGVRMVLEIGSGTGQHAVYFGKRMPQLSWQTSDLPGGHDGIRQWIEESALTNVLSPLVLDVDQDDWPIACADAVFTANTLHIAAWSSVRNMFAGVSRLLDDGGLFCVYGPFSHGGRHTSESNARFDLSLRAGDPKSGIRDFFDVIEVARRNRLMLYEDHEMPANNRLLVLRKET